MNTYNIELVLQPNSGGLGRRYINIKMIAEDEVQAKQFAVECVKTVVREDVVVFCK